MPVVTIQMLSGRSDDQKRGLVKDITDAVVNNCKVPSEQVWVVIQDVERDNWAMGGTTVADKAKG